MSSNHIFARDIPLLVMQKSKRDCWAAAMESWTYIVPGKTYRTQDELFLMAAQAGLVWNPKTLDMEGLLKKGIPVMAGKVGMKLTVFNKYTKKKFTPTWVYGVLKKHGHLYIAYHGTAASQGLAHAIVCYAVNVDDGWLGVMDPWDGQGYQWPYVEDMQATSKYFIIGYP